DLTLLVVQGLRRTARKSTAPYSGRSFPESSQQTPCPFPTLLSPAVRLMAREPSMKLFVLDTRGLDVWGIVGTLASGKRRNLSPRPQNGQDLGGDGFDVVRLELAPVGHIA